MAEAEVDVEQTLHIARAVSVYRIPPRPGANGWRSGEWLVSDKLFSGRLRVIGKGELCEIRLEDPSSGDLFATCPVQYGQRNVCVEPVTDSSRYYVLRVEDPATRRHAFLGMGFDNRSDAFDFNEALVRHEQQVARERATRARAAETARSSAPASDIGPAAAAAAAVAGSPPSSGGASNLAASPSSSSSWSAAQPSPSWAAQGASSSAAAEVEGLYRRTADLRLQEGQTIRVNVSGLRKSGTAAGAAAAAAPTSAAAGGKGFLGGGGTASAVLLPPPASGSSPPVGRVGLLAPPPSSSPVSLGTSLLLPVVSTSSTGQANMAANSSSSDHCHPVGQPLGVSGASGSTSQYGNAGNNRVGQTGASQQPVDKASEQHNWATFD